MPSELKIIDTGRFEIEVPSKWRYKKDRGIDSFVGRIQGKGIDLHFDWSESGYANPLIPDEREFVYERKWQWMPVKLPYVDSGVVYTSAENIKSVRESIMKENGLADPTLAKVDTFQIPKEEILYQEGNYTAILTYKDTTVTVSISIPVETKNHLFLIDTVGTYKRKIITPLQGTGTTGIYLEDLTSSFNFNLVGSNLNLENQERALKAFKSIKIKRELN